MKGRIGIELGTKHLRVCFSDRRQVFSLKNMMAADANGKIAAIGNEAFLMYEKEPSQIQMVTPMTHGVIGDYTNMRVLLMHILKRCMKRFRKYTMSIAVPVDITGIEKMAFYDLLLEASIYVKGVHLISKPLMDAYGCQIRVEDSKGAMVVNFGADTTEISVVSLGSIIRSKLLSYGGNQIDHWIVTRVKRYYNLNIGYRSAESFKIKYGKGKSDREVTLKGRDVISGLPSKIEVPLSFVHDRVEQYIEDVVIEVKKMLEIIPPELVSDITEGGIYLTGGGANFSQISKKMEEALDIRTNLMDDPDKSVIYGLKRWISPEGNKQVETDECDCKRRIKTRNIT